MTPDEKPKPKPTCPVCGHEVDSPISSDDLEEANADRFFGDAIADDERANLRDRSVRREASE